MAARKIESDTERNLVSAVAGMALQYLSVKGEEGDYLDSLNMNAGESALRVLEDYGLVDVDSSYRSGVWTELGERFIRGQA